MILELESTEQNLEEAKKLFDKAEIEKKDVPELSKKLEKEKINFEKLKSAIEKPVEEPLTRCRHVGQLQPQEGTHVLRQCRLQQVWRCQHHQGT